MCERAMLNERGGNGRCWMRREEKEGERRDESEDNAGKRDEREISILGGDRRESG